MELKLGPLPLGNGLLHNKNYLLVMGKEGIKYHIEKK